MSDPVRSFMEKQFGLGSSTFGKTMDEHNRGRTEAEARAARKPKDRCFQGEVYGDDPFERRMFKRCRHGFDDAIRAAEVAMEGAHFAPETIQQFKDIVADFCGDTWNVDPRKEE